ncbi:MAG TPA: hypothetical protein VKB46_19920 [Pyrinomonadaceae bacterium]|nr:hypothetical protein [Pyrinomonadaceae bacterium]
MLFLERKTLNYSVDREGRTRLLNDLQEQNLTPLIRTTRHRCFETLLGGPERIGEMEAAIAPWSETDSDESFVRGDVFCFSDYLVFLIFEDEDGQDPIGAGIVFEPKTSEPFRKLDSFCRTVRDCLLLQFQEQGNDTADFPEWKFDKQDVPKGFREFIANQDADSLFTSLRKETMTRRVMAASNLEDEGARIFLRTARNAHLEGYAAKLLNGETESYSVPIERLEDAGLVEKEVQVSCRKTGHALFRLPNAQALVVVTISDATCSECGSPIADERVEEVIAPTELASSLLEDGSWLVSRLHLLLREMGVPEREIALGPSEGTGYGQLMANVCGESFLLVTRDGDLTPAFARSSVDLEIATEACHLVIVATGRVHKEAGVFLQNHARRRISGGQDFEMILAGDVATAKRELEAALERVSQRVIAEQLCVLDNSIGLNVSRLVLTKFDLSQAAEETNSLDDIDNTTETYSATRVPLALAAHAAMGGGEIFDIDPESISSIEVAPVEVLDV